MRILIIEDNSDIVANLYEYFEPLGHDLDNARTGQGGLARVRLLNLSDCFWPRVCKNASPKLKYAHLR